MKLSRIRLSAVLFALTLGLSVTAHAAKNKWDRIDVPDSVEIMFDGELRTLQPSCSGGPQLTSDGLKGANEEFFFFVQKGNPNKLLFGVDGGGACWNGLTCIGSALTSDPTYTQELDETTESLAEAGGIFDARNPENPFAEYTKIFIPYCSADIHWGSKDVVYEFEASGFGTIEWPIRHRGADNFLAVLDWLKKNGRTEYNIDFDRARDVMVTGASAGGYGATLVFPYVAELTPRARLNLMSDAAIGVQTLDFYKTAIYNPENRSLEQTANWGIEKYLPPMLEGFGFGRHTLGSESLLSEPSSLPRLLFGAIGRYQPEANLASITTNFDRTQLAFYALQQTGDDGANPFEVARKWYCTMAAETQRTADDVPGYRYFIEGGNFHTFIGEDDKTYEGGVDGTTIAEWLRAMTKPGNRDWENLDDDAPDVDDIGNVFGSPQAAQAFVAYLEANGCS